MECAINATICKMIDDKDDDLAENSPHPAMTMVADTGSQVNVLGEDHIHRLGLSSDQLLPTNVELDCANATGTSVMGLFFPMVSGISVTSGTDMPARTMVYVFSGHACLISRGTLLVIGCLPQQFPEMDGFY